MSWLAKVRGMFGPPSGAKALVGCTALVADASVVIQKVASLTLEEQGCKVVVVGDGDAAISELGRRHVDVVLASTTLPKHSGYDLCE